MGRTTNGLIEPHGGELIDRVLSGAERTALEQGLANMPKIALPEQQQCDLEMIAIGAFSPLTGFMASDDFHAVCDQMQLTNGLPWGIPITFCVDRHTADALEVGQEVCLTETLSPGTYWLWVGPQAYWCVACGAGYLATIDGYTGVSPVAQASWGTIKGLYR